MPYYDYKCLVCNNTFEIQKGMNDLADPPCPKCGSSAQRVFNAPQIAKISPEQNSSCTSCATSACSTCNVK